MIGATLTYNENVDKIRLVKMKNHSVHEGTVPAGLGSTDVMMQDSDAEPKQIKPPGRTYLSLYLSISLSYLTYQHVDSEKRISRKIPT